MGRPRWSLTVCSSFQSGVDRRTSRLVPAISSVASTPTAELSAAFSGGFQGQTVRDARRLPCVEPDPANPDTEHPTREGKLYCCVVIDTFFRCVRGLGHRPRTARRPATNALGMAIEARGEVAGCI